MSFTGLSSSTKPADVLEASNDAPTTKHSDLTASVRPTAVVAPTRSASSNHILPRANTTLIAVSGTTFEIDQKYRFLKPIGHGAYGIVM